MKPLFVKESTLGLRLGVVLLVLLVLIIADRQFNALRGLRSLLEVIETPVYRVANAPVQALQWGKSQLVNRAQLQEDNARLRQENLILQGRSQQMASLQAENVRLRALLNSSAILRDDVQVAELIGVSPDPERHQLILNKGSDDGVFLGQALLDADGLLGQIVEVSPNLSRVLLITDATHSIPVQVNRNGVRAIAEGTGSLSQLEILHVSATTDIREGDLLVTSGLGGRFPAGYPVAVVKQVRRDPGKAFSTIYATPSAALDRSRHVLLVFTPQPGQAD
ncbi:rod shape-determining protein MreC [Haliea sp. E17]|uniref:rod shape-determining protein MreC n=1 Tax=Haliea sp. E17 TaxID=3401576 RepID=UPI003AABEB83